MKKTRLPKTKPSTSRRILKFFFLLVLLFAVVLTALQVSVDKYETYLTQWILTRIQSKTHGLYSISIQSTNLDFLMKSITIEKLKVIPVELSTIDTKTLKQAGFKTIPKVFASADIEKLELKGVSYWDFLFNHTLTMGHLILKEGKISLFRKGKRNKKLIEFVSIKDVSLELNRLSIYLKKMAPTENAPKQKIPNPKAKNRGYVYFKSGMAIVKDISLLSKNGFYRIEAETLNYSKPSDSIHIAGFRLIPQFRKYDFSSRKGHRTTRFAIDADTLVMENVDSESMISKQCFQIGSLTAGNLQIEMFQNRRLPKKNKRKRDIYPLHLLEKIRHDLSIGIVKIINGKITYSAHESNLKQPGKIYFSQVEARLENITNMQQKIKQSPISKLTVSSQLMGTTPFKLNMTMPLAHKPTGFSLTGKIGKFDIRTMNRILKNAYIRIDRGQAQRLDFILKGNSRAIKGQMEFQYKDLELSLLKRNKKQKRRWFMSFLANWLVKKENSASDASLRIGKIDYKKNEPMSFLTYLGKALLSGLKSSIGLKKAKK